MYKWNRTARAALGARYADRLEVIDGDVFATLKLLRADGSLLQVVPLTHVAAAAPHGGGPWEGRADLPAAGSLPSSEAWSRSKKPCTAVRRYSSSRRNIALRSSSTS